MASTYENLKLSGLTIAMVGAPIVAAKELCAMVMPQLYNPYVNFEDITSNPNSLKVAAGLALYGALGAKLNKVALEQ